MSERYIVFDVETPNSYNNRMSAIGITVVENGRITGNFYSLVNPGQHFDRFNIELTGISPADIVDSPSFPQLWEVIRPVMESGILIAHNAPFDMRVLASCINHYAVEAERYMRYACTCRMSKCAFPTLPDHKLNTLCSYLGIGLDHHNASSDSAAAAELMLRCADRGTSPERFIKTYDILNMRTVQ